MNRKRNPSGIRITVVLPAFQFMFILLISMSDPVMANDDISSDLICPCECAMVISNCNCTTAIQVKKEITQMKENGFSEKQILLALKAEYGKEIIMPPEKDISSKLWIIGAALSILFVFIGYIFSKKTKMDIIPDIKNYEQQFEEEYRNFISEIDDTNKNEKHISNDNLIRENKL